MHVRLIRFRMRRETQATRALRVVALGCLLILPGCGSSAATDAATDPMEGAFQPASAAAIAAEVLTERDFKPRDGHDEDSKTFWLTSTAYRLTIVVKEHDEHKAELRATLEDGAWITDRPGVADDARALVEEIHDEIEERLEYPGITVTFRRTSRRP